MLKKNLLISAGLAVFLFVLSFILYLNFSYMGASYKEAEEIIFGQFKWQLVLINLKLLGAYLVVAVSISAFSLLLNIEKPRNIFLFNLFIWFIFWVRGIKLLPQLFREQLYTKGFILKYFMVFITDYVPLVVIPLLFVLVVLTVGLRKKRAVYSIAIILIAILFTFKFDESTVKAEQGSNATTKPNVIIIATDSLRPQSISYDGYHRKTPNIDKLFTGGVNFLNAKTSMGRTLPTWTTILTSNFPPDHEMRHMFPTQKALQRNWTTMADVFNKNGYYTAVVSDFAGDIFQSMPYGFQYKQSPDLSIQCVLKQRCQEIHYFLLGFLINPAGRACFPEIWGMTLNKDPWYVTNHTKKTIKTAIKNDNPFFLVYFSSNNHFPYVTLSPYYTYYTRPNDYGKQKYGLSSDILESFLDGDVSPKDREQIVNHYDNATKLFDDNVGELLDYLKACNIDKNTIVLIMSDHGENLYEENYGLAHGEHLAGAYATNMVFGIYSPFEDFKGRKIKETVRDIDIAPTVIELAGLKIPASFKGTSLLPVMRGEPFSGLPAYMETGVWYAPQCPYLENRPRLYYPIITRILDIELPSGRIVLKNEFEKIAINAKYRAYQLNGKKYIYMPGQDSNGTLYYKEEFYIDEKQIPKEQITDPEFLNYKEKMVEMFKNKFYIDEKGFIREHIAD